MLTLCNNERLFIEATGVLPVAFFIRPYAISKYFSCQKVWALVIAILVLLVAASLGLARHISNLEQEVRENTSLMEHRILLASS